MSPFHLNHSIALWRRSRESNRAFTPDDLDELEQHLRDQVAGLVARGITDEEAFYQALAEMGDYGTAETEYRKVYRGKLLRGDVLREAVNWRLSMIKNYLTIALRNMSRRKGYTLLHTAGLSVGLACAGVVLLYAHDELSFDRFHDRGDRIYQIGLEWSFEGKKVITMFAGAEVQKIKETTPFVEDIVQFTHESAVALIPERAKRFEEEAVLFAGESFFQFFTFPLLQGDPAKVLASPGHVVLSSSAAQKYFGAVDPVGRILLLETSGPGANEVRDPLRLVVSGVAQDAPSNSSILFDLVVSGKTEIPGPDRPEPILAGGGMTYVRTAQTSDSPALIAALTRKMKEDVGAGAVVRASVTPLFDLHTTFFDGNALAGRITYLYFFTAVVVVILLVACINYVNLATAYASQRAREVGVRKTLGASPRQVARQFLVETILLALISGILAWGLIAASLPAVNHFFGKAIDLTGAALMTLLAGMSFLVVFVGFLAGSYPAFYLSRFKPAAILASGETQPRRGIRLRQALVVVQFAATVALLVATTVVFKQLQYARHRDLGFTSDHVVTVELKSPTLTRRADVIRRSMENVPGVVRATLSTAVPAFFRNAMTVSPPATPDDTADDLFVMFNRIDPDFPETYGLRLAAGRFLRAGETRGVVLNETAARKLGLMTREAAEAVGKKVSIDGDQEVIGIVKDFHYASVKNEIGPVFFQTRSESTPPAFLSLKLESRDLTTVLEAMERTWKRVAPEQPFEYHFVDEQFEKLYRAEKQLGQIFGVVALIAIVLAGLGLFGLAAFAAGRRTIEIGIRKVLGASVSRIVALVSKEFVGLIVLSFALGIPVAYVLMNRWLDAFAYRMSLTPGLFILAAGLVLFVAVVSISYQALRAATANPVKSLRYE